MKGIKLLLAILLALPAFGTARADDSAATDARAAVRRVTANSQQNQQNQHQRVSGTGTRGNNATTTQKTQQSTASRATTIRTTATPDNSRGGASVTNRVASGVQSRATSTPSTYSRTAVTRPTTALKIQSRTTPATITRSAASTTRTSTNAARSATRARSASATATASDIMNHDYSRCRTVYYECMDEFCANKDAQLKRCACSTRVNEFDGIKQQLANVDEKMLDFSQRLLTVNMDKEDAEALFQATEGELAFNQEDTSDSKKLLDEIAKKLNTSFDDSNFDQSLNAISLSLNVDAAFDSVDSLAGASTTTKTGTALYNAALPVCREMAAEVCDEDEISIVASSYQMLIEQDCNTVYKAYQTQADQARERVREGNALLDMSRLDIYQQRNSDDILTCKSKMLDMLTDSTVCGENMEKCLDTTGQYIDPTTGQAFLTAKLANLGNLITRPTGDVAWSDVSGNATFITYLNSKKKFLEPAMEQCQDIADAVWDTFIEDALAQIKLAQDAKLEEVRQSCTTLTTQCMSDTMDSIEDFDARALSTFGVLADKTVNGMCADVTNACTALMETTGGDQDWAGGIGDISTDITYDTILATCREVGRACIIQTCKSTSGNFGLCESVSMSVNRKSIINRDACWAEVSSCIAAAGDDKIAEIYKRLTEAGTFGELADGATTPKSYRFYNDMYAVSSYGITNGNTQCSPTTQTCIYDWCQADGSCTADDESSAKCQKCRLTEKIWGNCEYSPDTNLEEDDSQNKIRIPSNDSTGTLLSWFAQNTGTDGMTDSCRDTTCGPGLISWPTYDEAGNQIDTTCVSKDGVTMGDYKVCSVTRITTPKADNENCCFTQTFNGAGDCCPTANTDNTMPGITKSVCKLNDSTAENQNSFLDYKEFADFKYTPTTRDSYYTTFNNGDTYKLVCVKAPEEGSITGAITGDSTTKPENYPSGNGVTCSGTFMLINAQGRQMPVPGSTKGPVHYFLADKGKTTYTLKYQNNKWQWVGIDNETKNTVNTIDATASDTSMLKFVW